MARSFRWTSLMVLILSGACRTESVNTPACDQTHAESCVYASDGEPVCRQRCVSDAGTECPTGEVCTGASACCGDTPADRCRSPLVMVCCPPSGC